MIKIIITILFLGFLTLQLTFADAINIPEDAEKISLVAEYVKKIDVNEITIGDTKVAMASFTAFIINDNSLNGGLIDCKVTAYAAPGRGFSCGFSQMENVSGYCVLKDKSGETLVAKLECSSGATSSLDVRCEGKIDFISGTGKYAGVSGTARVHMEQIFTSGKSSIEFTGWWRLPVQPL
ncbi:hypothetical protein OAC06_00015 [Alphaproteobacteria bacterium]|nr:hypothetical protein [Alphaproteobacteria bacterium]